MKSRWETSQLFPWITNGAASESGTGSGKHSIKTHFPKDQNCDIFLRTKITRASCRRRTGTVVPRPQKFGDLIPADHKVLSVGCESRNHHRYAVVVQDLATQWLRSNKCKTKTSQENQKSLQKFLEPTRKPRVIYTDNSSECGKSCDPRTIVRQHHTDQKRMGLLREQCTELRKRRLRYCCNQVWVTNGGRIPWNVTAVCEIFRIFCLMGRHPMTGGSEYHLMAHFFHLDQSSNITYFCERPIGTTSIWS